MEINLTFDNHDFRNEDEVAQKDRLTRSIFQKFQTAVWTRNGNGYTISV